MCVVNNVVFLKILGYLCPCKWKAKPILVLLSKLSIVSEKDFYIKLTEGVVLTRVFFFNKPRNEEEYGHHEMNSTQKTAGCKNAKFPLIRKM
jgi:hypothetical protein